MLKHKTVRNADGSINHIESNITGHHLLNTPELNKACAFTHEERQAFGLTGLLPEHVETMEEQLTRMYEQFKSKANDLSKNVFLYALHESNETLFYKLVNRHLQEMLPIIYTPTIGDAVEQFSLQFRRPRGLFINYPERDNMEAMLMNRVNEDIDLIVVTDGEGVLGIGDQGIGGMDISIGKLMVYTVCAGIDPNRVLPIQLDVGTNNEKLLTDPMYLGWRNRRLSGPEYDAFIDQFVKTVQKVFPNVYLHWEDFGRDNARRNLNRYRQEMCTFNDDMQGTALVTLANTLSACSVIGQDIKDQTIAMIGAGTAGCGIADQLCDAMQKHGLSESEARSRFWLVDRDGLLLETQPNLPDFQQPYIRTREDVAGWDLDNPNQIMLADVVRNAKPTVLIGCSTVYGAFTESIVKNMAAHTARPIIMPLSNPTSHSEAKPRDLIEWTEGKVLTAAGSPYDPVEYNGITYRISQGNNAFIFPGIGLGVIAAKATRMTDGMLYAAALALSQCSPTVTDKNAPLLPDFDQMKTVSHAVAKAVAEQSIQEGVAGVDATTDIDARIRAHVWVPEYYPYRYIETVSTATPASVG